MKCSKCKIKITFNQNFCPNCGTLIPNKKNNKKTFGLISLIIVILLICFSLYTILFGFHKFNWNKNYGDFNLKYVTQTKVKLKINFDQKNIGKIKYKTNCGNINVYDSLIEWDLSESIGKCKITASYKLKKISKEFNVISKEDNKKILTLEYNIDNESDEDLDLDSLTNKQEKEYKTNPVLSDTDMDGLDDYFEINDIKTDPNKPDTDNDGITDYAEIEVELDPLKEDTKNDGIIDSQRILNYQYEFNGINLDLIGKGNISDVTVQITNETYISNKVGLIDKLYTFHTKGDLEKAIITIPYIQEDLINYQIEEDNLSLFYYNEQKMTYEIVDTQINKETKTLTVTLNHFSNYVIGDKSKLKEYFTSQILFILDNSWSMYSEERYTELTGKTMEDIGNDPEGLRFTLTSELATNLEDKHFELGLSEFRDDYKNILEIGSTATKIKNKVKSMDGNFVTKKEGTNIGNALKKGLKEFAKDSDYKYIVLLTDGEDQSIFIHEDNVIKQANEKKVKICTVGFGDATDSQRLKNIAESTGCKFYSSNEAKGLNELFSNLESDLLDGLVDIDNDNKIDGLKLADSGFIVNKDGFSFFNYGSNLSPGGHCYGMARFAQLYYKNNLQMKADSKTIDDAGNKQKLYAYDLSNTYFAQKKNLYSYHLKTNSLKHYFGFDYFDETQPADYFEIKDNRLVYSDTYKNEFDFYQIKYLTTTISSKEQLKKYGGFYETYEDVMIDEDKMQTSKTIVNDDKQLFNAILHMFFEQNNRTRYYSGTDLLIWAGKFAGADFIVGSDRNGFIELLIEKLKDKDPVVLSGKFYGGGGHAINAISLIQDIDDPNYYYLEVYDNSFPGKKMYLDLKCNKKSCLTNANNYYEHGGEPVEISLNN